MLRNLTITLNIIWVLSGAWVILDQVEKLNTEQIIGQAFIFFSIPILTLWYLLGNLKFIEIFKQGSKMSRKAARHLTITMNVLGALFFSFLFLTLFWEGNLNNSEGGWLFLLILAVTPIVTLWYLLDMPKGQISQWLKDNNTAKDLLFFTIKGLIVCGLVLLTLHQMNEWNLYIDIE